MSASTPVTAEQLFRMPDDGHLYELVAGEVQKMVPPGWEHGRIGGQLQRLLVTHVSSQDLGEIFLAETGFLLSRNPDTVRAPDIAFLSKNRLRAAPADKTFWPGAPDLVVEVVSPSDTFRLVDEKVKDWLRAGAAMVWVVNPTMQTVTVYRSAVDVKTLGPNDTLDGADVVPGFQCPVADLFVMP